MFDNPELATQIALGVLGGGLGLMIGLIIGQPMGAPGKLVAVLIGAASAAASVVFLTPLVLPHSQSFIASLNAPDERTVLEARLREEPLINAFLDRFPDETGGFVTRLQEASETGGNSAVDREIIILLRQFELRTYAEAIPRASDMAVRFTFESLRDMVRENRADPEFCRAYGVRPDIPAAAVIASRRDEIPGFSAYIGMLVELYNEPAAPAVSIDFEQRNGLLRPVGTAMRASRTPGEDWYWNQRRPRTEAEYVQNCTTLLRMFEIIESQRDPEMAMRAFFALTQE
ncbi:hypothetical protein [Hyphobacterium sp.]|uniref:hypothetical protein n=1 Tax=Hyphobacterium sp. TaxID=2004662 RepID=UPI003BA93B24